MIHISSLYTIVPYSLLTPSTLPYKHVHWVGHFLVEYGSRITCDNAKPNPGSTSCQTDLAKYQDPPSTGFRV